MEEEEQQTIPQKIKNKIKTKNCVSIPKWYRITQTRL